MPDTIEYPLVDGEIIEHRAPMTLFGTDDPAGVVERASVVATALAGVINERKLFSSISGKKHVQVEGWTLLGSMLGVFAEVEWSRPLDNGWEARAVARTLAGQVVGAAEAMCTHNEGRWSKADPYAVRSMAQTRAVSKALRLPLGFIMQLAGYSATPAEELNDEPGQGDGPSRKAGAAHPVDPVPAPALYPGVDQPASPVVMARKRYEWSGLFGWSAEQLDQAAADATNHGVGTMDNDTWRAFAAAVVKAGPTEQGTSESAAPDAAESAVSPPADPPTSKKGRTTEEAIAAAEQKATAA